MFRDMYNINVYELNENSETMEQPQNIKIKLKPHQLTLLNACINFENNRIKLNSYPNINNRYPNIQDNDYMTTNIGIIGDKVGSGKSYIILSLLLCNKEINCSQIESFGLNKIFINISRQINTYKTNLLIVPHNLFYQWTKYIEDIIDINDFNYKLILRKKDLQEFIEDANKLNNYELILISDTHFRQISNIIIINNIKINRVIFDEIDSLKIPNNKNISCKFYWFISASFSNLLYPKGFYYYDDKLNTCIKKTNGLSNNGYVKELFSNIYYCMKKEFAHVLVLKNDNKYIQQSFSIPEPNQFVIECKDPIMIKLLNGIVDKNIINYLNANNDSAAIELFNSKQKISENSLIDNIIGKYLIEIKNIDIQISGINEMTFNTNIELNNTERNQRISRLHNKKNDIQIKVDGIKKRIANNDLCSICYCPPDANKKTVVKCCSNIFCFKCINLWLCEKPECPLCKSHMKKEDIFLIQDKEKLDEIENKVMDEDLPNKEFDKLKNLEILLKNLDKNSKILIFTEYDISFESIVNILDTNNIKYSFLKGNKYSIENKLNNYKNNDLNVLLININFYGCGLNLENTTDIIMFHKFDAEIEKQVIGRAQRCGRTSVLNIHYLLNENEIANI
jgi:hypothetical protein